MAIQDKYSRGGFGNLEEDSKEAKFTPFGYRGLRFSNQTILANLDAVLQQILAASQTIR